MLVVESGDVIGGTVLDGQFGVGGSATGPGLWAAIVDSGGTLVAAGIINFGGVGVNTGGLAIDTVVTDGLLGVAGVASNTLVLNSGTEQVGDGGVTIGTTIEGGNSLNSGGLLWVFSGGVASDPTVSGGTFEPSGAGVVVASAIGTTVSGGVFDGPQRWRRGRRGGNANRFERRCRRHSHHLRPVGADRDWRERTRPCDRIGSRPDRQLLTGHLGKLSATEKGAMIRQFRCDMTT